MGRLIGAPYFMTPEAVQTEKDEYAEIRKLKKRLGPDYNPFDPEDPVRLRSAIIAREKQPFFKGHILRRTLDSVDNEGRRLIDIPPFKTIIVTLTLQDREMEILDQLHSEAKES